MIRCFSLYPLSSGTSVRIMGRQRRQIGIVGRQTWESGLGSKGKWDQRF